MVVDVAVADVVWFRTLHAEEAWAGMAVVPRAGLSGQTEQNLWDQRTKALVRDHDVYRMGQTEEACEVEMDVQTLTLPHY